MSYLYSDEFCDSEQDEWKAGLRANFSKAEPDNLEKSPVIEDPPVAFRKTGKLNGPGMQPRLSLPSVLNFMDTGTHSLGITRAPETPPVMPSFDVGNAETTHLSTTKSIDPDSRNASIEKSRQAQGPIQCLYDLDVVLTRKGIGSLLPIILRHQLAWNRVPSRVYVSPALAWAIKSDAENLYKRAYNDMIPFLNEQGLPVLISVVSVPVHVLQDSQVVCEN